MPRYIEGDFLPPKGRFAICVARFNAFITDELLEGAVDTLRRHGVEDGGQLGHGGDATAVQPRDGQVLRPGSEVLRFPVVCDFAPPLFWLVARFAPEAIIRREVARLIPSGKKMLWAGP